MFASLIVLLMIAGGDPAQAQTPPLFTLEYDQPVVPGSEVWGEEKPCGRFFAPLRLTEKPLVDPEGISGGGGAACPFAQTMSPAQQLIVEGLDASGSRLFVALSDDPRWQITETVGADGRIEMGAMGRVAADETYVVFTAPLSPTLALLRIWQVDEDNVATAIGDIPWVDVDFEP